MNKIPENSSAERLTRLLQRNLGTDVEQLKNGKIVKVKPAQADASAKNNPQATGQNQPSTVKHQQLSANSGLVPNAAYNKAQPNINQRAQKRKMLNEARKQHNIESIMGLAMEYCSGSSSTEDIDPDWFNQFIQLSEDTSSKMMQALWGKILAGEITHPGTFSFKSLTILKRMTNKEAIAFQHACQLAMTNRKDNSNQILYGYYQKPGLLNFLALGKKHKINLSKLQLPYPELLMLMDIELVYHSEIESGELNKGEEVEFSYLGKKVKFTAKRNGSALNYFKFTQTGCELAKLIRLTPETSYLNDVEQVFGSAFEIER
jgi:uncharacterized repeat protein (TIGR03899 family)